MNKTERKTDNYFEFIIDNKSYIYPIIFYIAGLVLGTALYKSVKASELDNLFNNIINVSITGFTSLFINRLSVYLSIFTVTVLLGMCLIGYPIISLIPLLSGFVIAIKISYIYFNYKFKGIGYSLLMIVPEAAALETVLVYAIVKSSELSRFIFKETLNKKDTIEEINLKSYLKSFILYFFEVIVIALINALLSYLLSSIIKL